MKKIFPYVLAFLIPFGILMIVFLFKDVLFGSKVLLISDAMDQYYRLLYEMKNVLSGTANIFYSFSKGLGGSMLATIAYYTASPLNLLLAFVSYENIVDWFAVFILIKVGLCGLTMFKFLKYHFEGKNILFLLIFSSCYALSGHIISNYFQIMWLDCFALAPLVLLGIDKIIDSDKSLLYGICLFFSILTNYYLGYMICLFSIIYFIYKLIIRCDFKWNKEFIKKKAKKFIIVSILAGLLTMFLNLPNLLEIISAGRTDGSNLPNYHDFFNYDYLGMASKMYTGFHKGSFLVNFTHPHLYFGLLILPLLYFYFVNKKINKKERVLTGIILIFFLFCFSFKYLNYLWHIAIPLGFNYRYMFLLAIFIIYIATKSFFSYKSVAKIHYFIVGNFMAVLSVLVYIRGLIPLYSIYVSLGLVLLYLYMLYQVHNNKQKSSKEVMIILAMLILGELYFNTHMSFLSYDYEYKKSLNGRYEEKKEIVDFIEEYNKEPFYRMEIESSKFNESFSLNYNGASVWVSSINDNITSFTSNLGYSGGVSMYKHNQHLITDTLFGIKYYTTDKNIAYYDKIGTLKYSYFDGFMFGSILLDTYIYENPYALSLGYMVDKEVELGVSCIETFNCHNNLISQMTNIDDKVYQPFELIKIDNQNYKFINTSNKNFVLSEVFDDIHETFKYSIYINGEALSPHSNRTSFVDYVDNNYEIGEEINIYIDIEFGEPPITGLYGYYIDMNVFEEIYDELQAEQLEILEFSDTYIKGKINVISDDKILFTSIPYQKGWKITVDGKEQDYIGIYTMIGLGLDKGEHIVEFEYTAPGLKVGVIVSVISLLLFTIYIYNERKQLKNK